MHVTTQLLLTAALLGVSQGEADRDRLLVVQHLEGALGMIDPATGETVTTLRVGDGPRGVSSSPDGNFALVPLHGTAAAGSRVAVVDLRAGRLARTIDLSWEDEDEVLHTYYRPQEVAFLPNGTQALVTVESHAVVLLVDAQKGVVLEPIHVDLLGTTEVLVDDAGRRAYVSGKASGSVSVIDLGQAREIQRIETGGSPSAMALHPTQPELWVANLETNSISVVDTGALEEILEFPCGSYPAGLAFTPDGQRLLCSNHQGGTVSVFQTEGRAVVAEVRMGRVSEEVALERPVDHPSRDFTRSALPADIRVDETGTLAWVACRRADEVVEIDLGTYEVTRRLVVGRGPTDLGWTVLRGERVEGK